MLRSEVTALYHAGHSVELNEGGITYRLHIVLSSMRKYNISSTPRAELNEANSKQLL